MKFRFVTATSSYNIESVVRIKDEQGVLLTVDTSLLLGDRFVTSYKSDGVNQVVELTDTKSIFSTSLLSSDGQNLRVIIDRERKILNPYLTINQWSLRQSVKKGTATVVTAALYPGSIADLPEFIPLKDFTSTNSAAFKTAAPKTPSQKTDYGSKDYAMVASAGVAAVIIGSLGQSGNSREEMSSDFVSNFKAPSLRQEEDSTNLIDLIRGV